MQLGELHCIRIVALVFFLQKVALIELERLANWYFARQGLEEPSRLIPCPNSMFIFLNHMPCSNLYKLQLNKLSFLKQTTMHVTSMCIHLFDAMIFLRLMFVHNVSYASLLHQNAF